MDRLAVSLLIYLNIYFCLGLYFYILPWNCLHVYMFMILCLSCVCMTHSGGFLLCNKLSICHRSTVCSKWSFKQQFWVCCKISCPSQTYYIKQSYSFCPVVSRLRRHLYIFVTLSGHPFPLACLYAFYLTFKVVELWWQRSVYHGLGGEFHSARCEVPVELKIPDPGCWMQNPDN